MSTFTNTRSIVASAPRQSLNSSLQNGAIYVFPISGEFKVYVIPNDSSAFFNTPRKGEKNNIHQKHFPSSLQFVKSSITDEGYRVKGE